MASEGTDIGRVSPLDDTPVPDQPVRADPPSAERMRSLRSVILSKMDSGDDPTVVGGLVEKFRSDLDLFSQGKDATEVSQALSTPADTQAP